MNPAEVIEVLERHGAVRRGHFLLSSGRHSDVYVEKFRVFEHPRLTRSLGEALAARFADERFELVASPVLGAVVLGFATALAAGTRVVFAERVQGTMVLRRGFAVRPHERVLVVEDVVTTGASAAEVVELVRASGGVPVGIGALLDRRVEGAALPQGVPFQALARLDAPSWDAGSCPLCGRGEPLEEPGSRRLT